MRSEKPPSTHPQ